MSINTDPWLFVKQEGEGYQAEITRLRVEVERLQDKATAYDLDQAGIALRASEAVELVELRAEVERLTLERKELEKNWVDQIMAAHDQIERLKQEQRRLQQNVDLLYTREAYLMKDRATIIDRCAAVCEKAALVHWTSETWRAAIEFAAGEIRAMRG